ncbi:hypothetical protein [Vibrio sp. H11]|uniref:hypothetical protein n=1 Tax=Vibrio sp. H11 TaxID=2565928 RepID=UPI0010A650C2|nr:hypothetical protein [Vibrio sp. H11]
MKTSVIKTSVISLTLASVVGCSSQYRRVEEPVEGKFQQSLDQYHVNKQGWEIVFRQQGRYYSHLGIAESVSAKVMEQQGVMNYSYSGSNPDDCILFTVSTFGLLWAIDTLMWTAQFGTSNTSCWSQVIDTDPYPSWSRSYATGQYAHYYRLQQSVGPTVTYKNKPLSGRFVEPGVWRFENNQLPADFDIADVKLP